MIYKLDEGLMDSIDKRKENKFKKQTEKKYQKCIDLLEDMKELSVNELFSKVTNTTYISLFLLVHPEITSMKGLEDGLKQNMKTDKNLDVMNIDQLLREIKNLSESARYNLYIDLINSKVMMNKFNSLNGDKLVRIYSYKEPDADGFEFILYDINKKKFITIAMNIDDDPDDSYYEQNFNALKNNMNAVSRNYPGIEDALKYLELEEKENEEN